MKTALFAIAFLAANVAWSQNTMTPTPTTPRTTTTPVVTSPNTLPAANPNVINPNAGLNLQNPVAAGVLSNNANRLGATNPFGANGDLAGGNVGLGDLQSVLLNLQANIEQALPSLLAFTGQGQFNPQSGALNGNLNPAVSRGLAPAQTRLPATGSQSPRELANGTVVGALGTNSFAVNPQTFQQLRVLAAELNEALPILQRINGSAATGLSGVNTLNGTASAGFTNLFVPLNNNSGVISPTGR